MLSGNTTLTYEKRNQKLQTKNYYRVALIPLLFHSLELSSAGSAYDKPVALPTTLPTTLPTHTPPPRCRHTAVSYNATLVSGINAGKFSTYGSTSTIEECARHCCRDNKCDLAFMIQGNCYTVECADAEGCQVKKAKSSNYNPTVAYVYRGNGKPIGGA